MSYAAHALSSSFSNDAYGSLFEPDVVLPSQFISVADDGLHGGERKLMAALLSDGIEAYIAQCSGMDEVEFTNLRTDVREWVDTKDEDYVFSFDNVCDCLGIDADYLRLGLTRYLLAIRQQRSAGGQNRVWKKIRRPRKK